MEETIGPVGTEDLNAVAPWDKMDDETDRGFDAFTVYRDLHPSIRTYREAANILGISPKQCHKWAGRFKWRMRATAWDRRLDKANQTAQIQSVMERRMQDRDREREIGTKLIEKALQKMEGMPADQVASSMVPSYLRQGVELIRLSDDLPTNKNAHEITGADGTPFGSMTDEQLAEEAEKSIQRLRAKGAAIIAGQDAASNGTKEGSNGP